MAQAEAACEELSESSADPGHGGQSGQTASGGTGQTGGGFSGQSAGGHTQCTGAASKKRTSGSQDKGEHSHSHGTTVGVLSNCQTIAEISSRKRPHATSDSSGLILLEPKQLQSYIYTRTHAQGKTDQLDHGTQSMCNLERIRWTLNNKHVHALSY